MRIALLASGALLAGAILVGCGAAREAARRTADGTAGQSRPATDAAGETAAGAGAVGSAGRAVGRRAEFEAPAALPAPGARADSPARALSRPNVRLHADTALTPAERRNPNFKTEAYDHIVPNDFIAVAQQPLSTFSIDVDTASYSNVRRFLTRGNLPPAGAVRIEELINYFPYDYEPPEPNGPPFAVHVEMASCPWNPAHDLARIALKGRVIDFADRPPVNLVFLIDVSGSMQSPRKLPYVQDSLRLLVDKLGENDLITMVVYAGAEGLALPPTTADHRERILAAIGRLRAGGSTNGGAGIKLAYDKATEFFIEGGVNRVILCTDGDFNVGITNQSALVDLIKEKAESGVFLSVLGFGMGNYKDSTMEKLADQGNGNYAYIDSISEARKVLVEQVTGTLITIAKDVKIQVDFNPARFAAYRLIGYENRLLAAQDFKDDTKDAGEIGAGHTVTALYELVPPEVPNPAGDVEPSVYQTTSVPKATAAQGEAFTVRLRYKEPDAQTSVPLRFPVEYQDQPFTEASTALRFATAIAQFGLLLRESEYAPEASWASTMRIAAGSQGEDEHGYRAEFLGLVRKAAQLSGADLPRRETARR